MDHLHQTGQARPGGSLRPLQQRDAAAVLAAFTSDPEMERQGTVRDLADAERYVAALLDPQRHHRPRAICDQGDSLVGLVVVSVDVAYRSGWFWYWMHACARGRGWTTAAAVTVANQALSTDGPDRLERLELGHRVNNPASAKVAIAAGFVLEGVEREKFLVGASRVDVLTYGRLRTDPFP